MLEDFKKFAMRGNVIDLAVGVIIGAAFGSIVSSLVGDVIMPIIGAITGGLDFSNYFLPLSSKVTADSLAEAKKQGAVLAWGSFITIVINFLIIAFVLFLAIKGTYRLAKAGSRKARRAAKAVRGGRTAHRDSRPPEKDLSFHAARVRPDKNRWQKKNRARSKSSPRTARPVSITRSARWWRPALR